MGALSTPFDTPTKLTERIPVMFQDSDYPHILRFKHAALEALGQLLDRSDFEDLTAEQTFGGTIELGAHMFLLACHMADDKSQQAMKDSLCDMLDELKIQIGMELPLDVQLAQQTFGSTKKMQSE